MRYRFDILTGSQRICDPEGAEFSDVVAVREEALRTVRELAAEELRGGRQLPVSWMLLIVDDTGDNVETLCFDAVLLPGRERTPKTVSNALVDHREIMRQSEDIVHKIQVNQMEVRDGLSLAWSYVRQIGDLTASLLPPLDSTR